MYLSLSSLVLGKLSAINLCKEQLVMTMYQDSLLLQPIILASPPVPRIPTMPFNLRKHWRHFQLGVNSAQNDVQIGLDCLVLEC